VVELDFSRCRDVWVPDDSEAGGFWSPPFEHVKEGVRWIIEHPYGLLATEMGGAKTAQALIAAQFLHDMDVIDRVIVIAPASVRPKVWYDRDLGQISEQVF
jgi:SNF2 family DNA or RNA helicase